MAELDTGEAPVERARRDTMALVLVGAFALRLVKDDIRVAYRAELKWGIEHWVTPLLWVSGTSRATRET